MLVVDQLVLGYLAYLTVVAWATRLPARRRAVVTGVAAADALLLWRIAEVDGQAWHVVRAWLPAAQILIGYWLSGAFYQRPMPALERRLLAWDRLAAERWGGRRIVAALGRPMVEALELAYLGVSVLVPAGFGVVFAQVPDLDADRYWRLVVAAELGCYAWLPWFQTRTPAALGSARALLVRPSVVRRLNGALLARTGIGANTFPSGHAAGAVATALAVGHWLPVAGAVLAVWAVAIMAASVIGRYHYLADALAGAALAVGIWLVWRV